MLLKQLSRTNSLFRDSRSLCAPVTLQAASIKFCSSERCVFQWYGQAIYMVMPSAAMSKLSASHVRVLSDVAVQFDPKHKVCGCTGFTVVHCGIKHHLCRLCRDLQAVTGIEAEKAARISNGRIHIHCPNASPFIDRLAAWCSMPGRHLKMRATVCRCCHVK